MEITKIVLFFLMRYANIQDRHVCAEKCSDVNYLAKVLTRVEALAANATLQEKVV